MEYKKTSYPPFKKIQCGHCEGKGIEYMSCCGEDMRNYPYNNRCPSCGESIEDTEGLSCFWCDGFGYMRRSLHPLHDKSMILIFKLKRRTNGRFIKLR